MTLFLLKMLFVSRDGSYEVRDQVGEVFLESLSQDPKRRPQSLIPSQEGPDALSTDGPVSP